MIMIPSEFLDSVEFLGDYFSQQPNLAECKNLVDTFHPKNLMRCTLDLIDLYYFKDWTETLPNVWLYTIWGTYWYEQIEEELSLPLNFPTNEKIEEILKNFAHIKISSIKSLKIKKEFLFNLLINILELDLTKENLEYIDVELPTLSCCQKILELLSQWRRIHTIKLKYYQNNSSDEEIQRSRKLIQMKTDAFVDLDLIAK